MVGVTSFNARLKVKYSLGGSGSYTTEVAVIALTQVYSRAEEIKDAITDSLIPI